MAKQKTLNDLFLETLKDVYYAEKQGVRGLQKAAKASQSDMLRQALEQHREETQGQVERLEQVFEMLGKPARGTNCEAIQGITAEMQEVMEDFGESPAADAALIGSIQAMEHYEIARYGTLKTWAGQLGMQEAADLLDETLQEEKKTDERLTEIAEQSANEEADENEDEDEDEDGGEEEEQPKRGRGRQGASASASKGGRGASAKRK